MGEHTRIAWCDHTFSAWWGCTKVSLGCRSCYAERLAHRYGHDVWGPTSGRRLFSDQHWAEPRAWDRVAARDGVRMRVFCGSMCDVFEDYPGLDPQRSRLWELIGETPNLDWLLLTKRPENVAGMWGGLGAPNVWLGTSVEDQRRAKERIPILLALPAAVRFLSVEPLLEPVRLILSNTSGFTDRDGAGAIATEWIHWVIIGGESGAGARPMDLEWTRAILKKCQENRVPFFLKQLGGHPDKRDDPGAWPKDLRVREFPRGHK